MTDKTAIEGIAQVLSKAHKYFVDTDKDYDTVYFGMADYFIKNRLTIAALDAEKPAEDATDFERSLLDLSREPDKAYIYLGYIKKHFAETYHAARCKECKERKKYSCQHCGAYPVLYEAAPSLMNISASNFCAVCSVCKKPKGIINETKN